MLWFSGCAKFAVKRTRLLAVLPKYLKMSAV